MADTISCVPSDLAQSSKCFCYADQKQVDAVIIYLLATIAGDTSTPSELASKAKCFCYPDTRARDAVMLYLLCNIASSLES